MPERELRVGIELETAVRAGHRARVQHSPVALVELLTAWPFVPADAVPDRAREQSRPPDPR